jgi:hypothetical protein
LTHSETHTFAQELSLAKALKRSMKFAAKSSGLSAAEKASLAGVNAAGKKPKLALDLFGSDSSAFDDEAVPSKRPRKRPRESSILKQMSKPPPVRGMFDKFVYLSLYSKNYNGRSFFVSA